MGENRQKEKPEDRRTERANAVREGSEEEKIDRQREREKQKKRTTDRQTDRRDGGLRKIGM